MQKVKINTLGDSHTHIHTHVCMYSVDNRHA